MKWVALAGMLLASPLRRMLLTELPAEMTGYWMPMVDGKP